MATKSDTTKLVERLKQSGFWRNETEGELRRIVRMAMNGGMSEAEVCSLVESTWGTAKGEYGE